jgi:hypothetical protein
MAGLTGKNLKDQKLAEEITHSITSLPGLTIIPLNPKRHNLSNKPNERIELDYEDAIHLAAALKKQSQRK